ncbi:MAG: MBL fold metallo-hydrolase [Candidatus Cloacimonetes bacterium]|nr:MBL fold metallo-hydrolase [Candidatus Cloacimonadota bacterium]
MLKKIEINDSVTIFQSKSGLLNSTVLEYSDYLVIIDTLLIPSEINELNLYIKSRNKQLKYIINTHFHSDHCYGNPVLKQDATKIIVQECCMETLLNERNMLRKDRAVTIDKLKILPPDVSFYDSFDVDNNIRILHSPGHTPDSTIVYLENEQILIAGDTVLNGDGITIPYFYWGNPFQLLESIKRIQTYGFKTLIPGHGQPNNGDKLYQDILYLTNLIMIGERLISSKKLISEEQFLSLIPASECIPGTKQEDYWVYKMHELNVLKLYRLLSEKL